jgi:hypothetical protein
VVEPPTRPLPADFDYDTCIATFAPIVRCYVHNFDDPACSRNARYRGHLHGWATAPDRHYKGQICIAEYYGVSGYKCLPVNFSRTMANDIPLYFREGARHFHYMHVTTENWGTRALTNWQMARQLWDPHTDCTGLWDDYFAGRYRPVADDMRDFYAGRELKYGLARRLGSGDEELFPDNHLKYEAAAFETDDGPDLQEMLSSIEPCRAILTHVMGTSLPERVASRIKEDEQGFTYAERTLRFYDALCRAYAAAHSGNGPEGRAALADAQALAGLLKADTRSTQFSSSHANAPDALAASFAEPALKRIEELLQEGAKQP